MGRILPEVERALGSRRTKIDTQRKDLAVLDEAGRFGDLLRGDEVQCPEFVGLAPAPPVADVVGDPTEITHAGHHSAFRRWASRASDTSPNTRSATEPPSTQITWPVM